jgi:chitin disaccharide deacetylase
MATEATISDTRQRPARPARPASEIGSREERYLEERYLIVNADDFGLSRGVNRGILQAHRHGMVTSASLMVRWPAAAEAAAIARDFPSLSVGLHLDLGEWAYRDGEWIQSYKVGDVEDPDAVAREVRRQLQQFYELTGRSPTHLDSHQHVHRQEPVASAMRAVAAELAIPLRHYTPEVRYCGDFYGQTAKGDPLPEMLGVDSLIGILTDLLPGTTELGCHPGFDDELETMYCQERRQEVHTLCDGKLEGALAELGIELRSFHDIVIQGATDSAQNSRVDHSTE